MYSSQVEHGNSLMDPVEALKPNRVPVGAIAGADVSRRCIPSRRAVDDGRIITVEAADRLAVPEAESRRVYKQELCYDCGTPIVTGTIEGWATYACPRCQPKWAG
jgi:hypothetical protein